MQKAARGPSLSPHQCCLGTRVTEHFQKSPARCCVQPVCLLLPDLCVQHQLAGRDLATVSVCLGTAQRGSTPPSDAEVPAFSEAMVMGDFLPRDFPRILFSPLLCLVHGVLQDTPVPSFFLPFPSSPAAWYLLTWQLLLQGEMHECETVGAVPHNRVCPILLPRAGLTNNKGTVQGTAICLALPRHTAHG